MPFLVIFVIGWVMCHISEGRTAEFRASQKAHRKAALKDLKRKHPTWDRERRERSLKNSARRNAAGHLAYQLRHGWFPTFADLRDGYRTARDGHDQWRGRRADGQGTRNPFWAGWRGAHDRKKAEREAAEKDGRGPDDDPTPTPGRDPEPEPAAKTTPPPAPSNPAPAPPEPSPAAQADDRPDAEVIPIKSSGNASGSTNGGTAVEAPSLDAAKAALADVGQWASTKSSGLEQVAADAMAGGLGADGESMKLLANCQEALNSAAGFASAFVASTAKHAPGQEYADSGHAAKTEYVKSS